MKSSGKRAGRITIGIPTYNRSQFAVRALRSALAQTYLDLEIVISDNCSPDDTVARIEDLSDSRVVLVKQPQNVGAVANFNACLERATGELFLLLSDDDILQPTAAERLAGAFLATPDGVDTNAIGLSWCPCDVVNAAGQRIWTSGSGPATESPVSLILGQIKGIRGARLGGIMVRTEDAIAVGGYDEERYGPLCDMGNWMRIALKYQFVACINVPLASYTMHSMSGTSQGMLHEWLPFVENFNEDLAKLLSSHGDAAGEKEIRIACMNNISNVLATILLQRVGMQGQLSHIFRETIRWRRYLLTAFVARRILRDGWKIFQMQRRMT